MSDTLFDAGAKPAPAKIRKRMRRAMTEHQRALTVAQPRTLLQVIAELAADPSVDPGKMKALAEIERETEAKQRFNEAMVAMTPKLPSIRKDGKITLKGGGALRFASFENIHKTIQQILTDHGFTFWTQPDVHPAGQGMIVRCYLERGSYTRMCVVPVPTTTASPAMNAQQAVGAAIAYAKRYGIISLLNLISEAAEDRDTDATAPEKPVTQAQHKKMVEAMRANKVPDALVIEHYVKPYCNCKNEDADDLVTLPAKFFNQFMNACKSYGERNK